MQKFQLTIDVEIKHLQSIINCEEEQVWQLRLLGDYSAQSLIDIMVFQISLYFFLEVDKSSDGCIITLCKLLHLDHQEGIPIWSIKRMYQRQTKGHYIQPKVTVHYSSQCDPSQCLV